ncbi:MAG: polyprenyl synthetase family protein [Cyclobacteriaceae bacterium]
MIKEELLRKIQKDLENHINHLDLRGEPKELYEPITYLMQLGGKRIRPLLTLLSYKLYQEDYESILNPAAAVEVFHNFTLVHDDIMDKAPIRRGKATIHEKWDANTAILSGDVMLVKAYEMLLEIPGEKLAPCLKLFSKTAAEVCEGQQLDMNFENSASVSEVAYLNMIRLKTAVLLGFSLQLGSVLAGAEPGETIKLYNFGVNIGIGFQLKDDLLDVYADKSLFGKQVGGDIISNKKTYLLIKALEIAKGDTKASLYKWLERKDFQPDEKVKAVTGLYNQLDIRNQTTKIMTAYFEKGFDQLAALKVKNAESLQILWNFTHHLVNREK